MLIFHGNTCRLNAASLLSVSMVFVGL